MAIRRQEFGDRHSRGMVGASDHCFGGIGARQHEPEFRHRPPNLGAAPPLCSSFGALNIDGSLADHPSSSRPHPPRHQPNTNERINAQPRGPSVPPHPPNNNGYARAQPTNLYGGGGGEFGMDSSHYPPNNIHPRSSVAPPLHSCYFSTPNLAPPNNGCWPTVDQPQRRRRQKYMPPMKTDEELFNERNHIQPGDFWEEQFGAEKDDHLTISCMEDGTQLKQLIQQFEDCNFSQQIMFNIKLRKYVAPTQIQKSVIPVIQRRLKADVMAHAQTGSGKSAAFLLPIINEIQRIKTEAATTTAMSNKNCRIPNSDSPYTLIIVPTKELAEQLFTEGRSFSVNTGVGVQRTYGDMFVRESKKHLQSGCDICIATCGRLLHFVRDGTIKLDNLRFLVLDEADKLLSCENFHLCVEDIKHHQNINPNHRVLMFSATFNNAVQGISQKFLRRGYIFINVGLINSAVDTIDQEFIQVHKFYKQERLIEILKRDAVLKTQSGNSQFWQPALKTLVFVEQKRQSDRLAIALVQEGFRASSLNSDRTLQQRMTAVSKFTHDAFEILVSTDVAARGLNFPNVRHVINFDLPEQIEDKMIYIHRIGRTGRAGNTGRATSFFDPASPEDTTNAGYYIEVLSQARLPIPEFLRCHSSDDSSPPFGFCASEINGQRNDPLWGNSNNNAGYGASTSYTTVAAQSAGRAGTTTTREPMATTSAPTRNANRSIMLNRFLSHPTIAETEDGDDSTDLFSVANDSDVWG